MSSRRAILGGGVVAGAAILAPLALRRAAAGVDGVVVVSGGMSGAGAAFRNDPAEIGRWKALVGRPVRLAGADGVGIGTVAAVEPQVVRGRFPAGVRQQPFVVRFAVDPAGAPKGDAVYDIGTTIDGLDRVFLQRSADVAGKAILTALFG